MCGYILACVPCKITDSMTGREKLKLNFEQSAWEPSKPAIDCVVPTLNSLLPKHK